MTKYALYATIVREMTDSEDPEKEWNDLIEFVVSNRATYVDNNKPKAVP